MIPSTDERGSSLTGRGSIIPVCGFTLVIESTHKLVGEFWQEEKLFCSRNTDRTLGHKIKMFQLIFQQYIHFINAVIGSALSE